MFSPSEIPVPEIRGVHNVAAISATILFIFIVGIFQHVKRAKEVAAQPVDVQGVEPALGQIILILLLVIACIISYAGVLFIPAKTWHDLGTGLCAGLCILGFIYAVQRYVKGTWRSNPKMTKSRALMGVAAIPAVGFFLFWGALVLTGGAAYTAAAGHDEKLTTELVKSTYHDKGGQHYCLSSDDFANGHWVQMMREFCGLEPDDFNALPPHFKAELNIRRSALGFIVIDYKRKD